MTSVVRRAFAPALAISLFGIAATLSFADQMTVSAPAIVAGAAAHITVSGIVDQYGNPDSGHNVELRVTNPAGNRTTTLNANDASGSAAFTLSGEATHQTGAYSMIASTGGAAGQGSLTVNPGAPAGIPKIVLSTCINQGGSPPSLSCTPSTSIYNGALLGISLTGFRDVYGNLVTSGSVSFHLSLAKNAEPMDATGSIITDDPLAPTSNQVLVPTTGSCTPSPCTPTITNEPVTFQLPCVARGTSWYLSIASGKRTASASFAVGTGPQVVGALTTSNGTAAVTAGSALRAQVQWTDVCGAYTGDGEATFTLSRVIDLDPTTTPPTPVLTPVATYQAAYSDGTPDQDDGPVVKGRHAHREENSRATATIMIQDGTGYSPVLAHDGAWVLSVSSTQQYPAGWQSGGVPVSGAVESNAVILHVVGATPVNCVATESVGYTSEGGQFPAWTATFSDRFGNPAAEGTSVQLFTEDAHGNRVSAIDSGSIATFNGTSEPTTATWSDAHGQSTGGVATVAIDYTRAGAPVAAPPAGSWTSYWGLPGSTDRTALCSHRWIVNSGPATGTFSIRDARARRATDLTTITAGQPTTVAVSGITDRNGDPVTQGTVTLVLTGPSPSTGTRVASGSVGPAFGTASVVLPGGLTTQSGDYTLSASVLDGQSPPASLAGSANPASIAIRVKPGPAVSNMCLGVPDPFVVGNAEMVSASFCNGSAAPPSGSVTFVITTPGPHQLPNRVEPLDANGIAWLVLGAQDDTIAGQYQVDAFGIDASGHGVGGQYVSTAVAGPPAQALISVSRKKVQPTQSETLVISAADAYGNFQFLDPDPSSGQTHLVVTGTDANGQMLFNQTEAPDNSGHIRIVLGDPYVLDFGTWTFVAKSTYDTDLAPGTATFTVQTAFGPLPTVKTPTPPPVP
ncbi:MAG: hypothetical protein ACYDAY_11325 [Candidatus Dormibacteria bacterium]